MSNNPAGRIYVYSAPGYDTEWSRTVGSTTVRGRGRFKVGYTGRPDPGYASRSKPALCTQEAPASSSTWMSLPYELTAVPSATTQFTRF